MSQAPGQRIDSGARRMLASHDTTFALNAAQSGFAEVKMGQLAEQKGSAAEVKAYGRQMEEDHSKINAQLAAIARKQEMTLPQTMNARDQTAYDKLKLLSGEDFDKAYARAMLKDHRQNVKAFRREAKSGKDSDIGGVARGALPVLESHLDKIKGIQSKVSSKKSSM